MNINPVAVYFVIFTSAIGHIFGHTDIGLAIGTGFVLLPALKG